MAFTGTVVCRRGFHAVAGRIERTANKVFHARPTRRRLELPPIVIRTRGSPAD